MSDTTTAGGLQASSPAIHIAFRFHINFYHSYRGNTLNENGIGKDIRIITGILDDLDRLNDEGVPVRGTWDIENYYSLEYMMRRHAPELIERIGGRVRADRDEVEPMSYNNGLVSLSTEEEFRAQVRLMKSNPGRSGLADVFDRWQPILRPQESMYTPSFLTRYPEEGIPTISLYYSAVPFNAFSNFIRPLRLTERYNPLTLTSSSLPGSMTLLPAYNHGDIADHWLSLRRWVGSLHRRQKKQTESQDLLVLVDADADDDFWAGMGIPILKRLLPSSDGLYRLVRSVADLPYVRFTRPGDYLATHEPVGTVVLDQDTADGSFDGLSSWAEKWENTQLWNLVQRSRDLANCAEYLALESTNEESDGPSDGPAGQTASVGADKVGNTDKGGTSVIGRNNPEHAKHNQELSSLVDCCVTDRLLTLSTTHFGLASPVMNVERLAEAMERGRKAVETARTALQLALQSRSAGRIEAQSTAGTTAQASAGADARVSGGSETWPSDGPHSSTTPSEVRLIFPAALGEPEVAGWIPEPWLTPDRPVTAADASEPHRIRPAGTDEGGTPTASLASPPAGTDIEDTPTDTGSTPNTTPTSTPPAYRWVTLAAGSREAGYAVVSPDGANGSHPTDQANSSHPADRANGSHPTDGLFDLRNPRIRYAGSRINGRVLTDGTISMPEGGTQRTIGGRLSLPGNTREGRWRRTETRLPGSDGLYVAFEITYPETPDRGYNRRKAERLGRGWDKRWREVIPLEIRPCFAAPAEEGFRVIKHNFFGDVSVYRMNYHRFSKNRRIDSANNHITNGWVAISNGGVGLLIAQYTGQDSNFAFCPVRTRVRRGLQRIRLNPFGTYYGNQLRYATAQTGIGRFAALLTADQLDSYAPSYNGRVARFSLAVFPFYGELPPEEVQHRAQLFAANPLIVGGGEAGPYLHPARGSYDAGR